MGTQLNQSHGEAKELAWSITVQPTWFPAFVGAPDRNAESTPASETPGCRPTGS
jgi:hypothetical protein